MVTGNPSQITGGAAVVKQLEQEGIDQVYGIPGVHTLAIYDELIDSDIDHYTTRHEQGAGFMADGYARTTDNVGVLLVITGPGLTNAATPIAQAYSDSSPVLVISSDNETTDRGHGKGLLHELKDQDGVMESMTAYSETVTRVNDIPQRISSAFDYLRSHRPRAVHIQIPMDVLARSDTVTSVQPNLSPTLPEPSPDRIENIITQLENADQPLLIVGGGAITAHQSLREFVEKIQIPVVSTTAGKGVIPESHPCSLGARFRDDSVSEFVENCDVALAIGTELSPLDLRGTDLPDNLIHVDIDYENIGKNQSAAEGIVGDASAVSKLLLEQTPSSLLISEQTRSIVESIKKGLEQPSVDSSDQRKIVLAALNKGTTDETILVFDMTKVGYLGRRLFPMEEPGKFVFPRGYGTLGFSPPAAFGAATANENRDVVAVVGDGGAMFTIQDLATAVKYDLSVPVVICNDESYGVIGDHQCEEYGRTTADQIDNPDFVALARSFGAAGTRISITDVPTKLPQELDNAFDRGGPTIIEIPFSN